MKEYTKKQRLAIATAVFRKLDSQFEDSNSVDNNPRIRLKRAQQTYQEFLIELESVRERVLPDVESEISTKKFFEIMRKFLPLSDEVIEREGLLRFWVADEDEEWKKWEEERKKREESQIREDEPDTSREAAE